MKRIALFLTVAAGLAAVLSICVPAPASAADSLDSRMDRLERDMRQLQQDYYSSAQGGGQRAQGGSSEPSAGADGALSDRMNSLEEAVRDLRGQVEQMNYQQRQILQRLDAMQGAAPQGSPPPPPPPGKSGDAGPTGAPQDDQPTNLAANGAVTPPPPPPNAGSLGTLPAGPEDAAAADDTPAPSDEKGQYEAALGKLYSGNRAAGIKELQSFVKHHPKSKQVPAAYYWLGEAQLADKSYRDAGQNFLTVVTKYPKDPMAPKSLVKLGSALIAGGQAKDGCKYLKSVKQVFPRADKSIVEMANRERQIGKCA